MTTTINTININDNLLYIKYDDESKTDSYPLYWTGEIQMIVPIKLQGDTKISYLLVDTGSGALAIHIDNNIDSITNLNENECNNSQKCGSINCCNNCLYQQCEEDPSIKPYITKGATILRNKLNLNPDTSLNFVLDCYESGGWYGFKTNSSFVFVNDINTNKNSHSLDINFPICSNSMPWTSIDKTIINNYDTTGIIGFFIGNEQQQSTIINYMLSLNYTCFEISMPFNKSASSLNSLLSGKGRLSFSDDISNIKTENLTWIDIPIIANPFYWSIQKPVKYNIYYIDTNNNPQEINNKNFPSTNSNLIVDSGTNNIYLPLGFYNDLGNITKLELIFNINNKMVTLEIDNKFGMNLNSEYNIIGSPLWYSYPNIIFNTQKVNNSLLGNNISFGK